MINLEKLNIFKIDKAMKNEMRREKENSDERPYTFKITKRRSPWTPEEDEAITVLVNKYGTGNWTLIANEMSNVYGFKSRSGKQCRERWHNHLDPSINKDYWTEKEENVLFLKHMEYGNKWSDIAKFLPGRTDNAIKNHFYSKLRKFIRKILKQINKDNLLKTNGIDPNKYNSDRVYKMIKKNKLPYQSLNKDSILTMILNFERSSKNNKGEAGLLSRKTLRKKSRAKENIYSERSRRYGKEADMSGRYEEEVGHTQGNIHVQGQSIISRSRGSKSNIASTNSLYATNINTRAKRFRKDNFMKMTTTQTRSKRSVKRRHMGDDFIYENEDEADEEERNLQRQIFNHNGSNNKNGNENGNGKDLIKRNLNIIINKSALFKNYVKEEEERLSSKERSSEKSTKKEFNYAGNNNNIEVNVNNNNLSKTDTLNLYINQSSSSTNPSIQPIPLLNPLTSTHNSYILDDRLYRYDTFPYMDPTMPLISPINPNTKLYPQSTRNYFNIDLLYEGNYTLPIAMPGYNIFRANPFNVNNFITTPTNLEKISFNAFSTPNKEVSMQNKILINEEEEVEKSDRTMTPSFKPISSDSMKVEENPLEEPTEKKEKKGNKENTVIDFKDKLEYNKPEQISEFISDKKKIKRPSIDLNLINSSETGKIFSASVTNKFTNIINKAEVETHNAQETNEAAADIKTEPQSEIKEIVNEDPFKEEEGTVTNISDKSAAMAENKINPPTTPTMIANNNNNNNKFLNTSNLTVSPKSAFVKMKK